MGASAKTWFTVNTRSNGSGDIVIFGDIGGFGITAQDFNNSLSAFGKGDDLNIRISSDGGDVFVGFAIYNMLKRHPANKIITIEGLAASMASVIVMAGDEVVMPANAMLMIHNPWGAVVGESDQVISFGEALQKMREGIARAYTDRTGIKRGDVIKMMDRETWLDAKEATAKGFADRIEKPVKMAANFDISRFSRFNHVPAKFGRLLKENAKMTTKNRKPDAPDDEFEGEPVAKSTAEIRAELLSNQKEIRSLCKIAGKLDLAEGFISDDKSMGDVIAALDKLAEDEAKEKAKETKGKGKASDETNPRHNPNATEAQQASLDPVAIYNKWNSAGKRVAAG